MGEEIPKKKLPEIEITKETINDLKVLSAITNTLAENPPLINEIANIFKQFPKEGRSELVNKITIVLAKKIKNIPADELQASSDIWIPWLFPPEDSRFPPEAPPMWRYFFRRGSVNSRLK